MRQWSHGSRSLLLGLACGLLGPVLAVAGDFAQRHAAAHVLSNGNLTVEVMDPNDPARYYRGPRFSPVANVLRVVKDGKDYLFSPVANDPENENGGLAMEFDILTKGGPPGFTEATIGEGFLKIGVGVLRKIGVSYRFEKQNELIEAAQTTVTWERDRAAFEQVSEGVNGYAYKLSSEVQLREATISIRYHLTNTGTKPFTTEQYAHNFFSFSDAPVGPDYEVEFPYDFQATGLEPEQRKEGRTIIYEQTVPKPMNIEVPMPEGYSGPNTVNVRHSTNGQEITATTSIPGTRTFLHASAAYLCPEQFVRISVKPGESAEWTREYTFL